MDIDELKPGRELDALVAEKVMGWKREEYWTAIGKGETTWHTGLMGPDGLREVNNYPDYSTDIAAAWDIIDKADWWSIESEYSSGVLAVIALNGGFSWAAKGETAQHAICLAALMEVNDGLV